MEADSARGVQLYKSGDYAAAVSVFSAALDSVCSSSESVSLFNNRAACFLKLGDAAAALGDSMAALQLDPVSAKAHFRRAQALQPSDPDAAAAVAAAAALSTPHPGSELKALYGLVAAAHATSSGLRLPPIERLCSASSVSELYSVLQRGVFELVVLRPGSYVLSGALVFRTPCGLLSAWATFCSHLATATLSGQTVLPCSSWVCVWLAMAVCQQ